MHREDRVARERAINRALATRGEYEIEYRVQQPDERRLWPVMNGRPRIPRCEIEVKECSPETRFGLAGSDNSKVSEAAKWLEADKVSDFTDVAENQVGE